MDPESSNTPSRKRSRWDNEQESPREPSPKRIPRQKRPKTVEPEVLEEQSRLLPNPPRQSQSSHSVFVPPRIQHPPIVPSRSVYSYERLNQIEEGSYGVVYRARDKQTGDIVALKKLKLDEEKHGFPITALREINALMACRHENVVGIREVVVGDTLTQYAVLCFIAFLSINIQRVFIVMDFIEHDLKTLLTVMPSTFLQSEIKTLMKQLVSAVVHCHKHWILHRDLKTSNLLMNNRGTIKVADFGLARRYGDPVGVGGLTQLVVTLWYRYVSHFASMRLKIPRFVFIELRKFCWAPLHIPLPWTCGL